MTTQYTPTLKLALPVTGELSGTWGDVVNDNITSMVEQAIAGLATINTWTANSHTLTTVDGTTSESRCAMLVLTDTGTALSGAATVVCPTASKIYIVKNTSGQSATIKTAAGTGVAIPNGETMFVFCDGTNVVQAVTRIASADVDFAKLKGTGAVVVTNILDEDNMASDSATALATQQSIKAYVDAQVGSFDTLAEVLAQGNTTGGTDLAVSAGDDITFTATSNAIFADNGKAIFGAGSDLQIYHDGSNSYITDAGTGKLNLRSDGTGIDLQTSQGETMLRALKDSYVRLYYDNAEKLDTTATGIDVTGTVVADGLTVGNTSAAASQITITSSATGVSSIYFADADPDVGRINYDHSTNALSFVTANTTKVTIDSTGSVGIGTSSPPSYGATFTVVQASNSGSGVVQAQNTTNSVITEIESEGTRGAVGTRTNHDLAFKTNQTERMRLNSTGLGIGTSSPAEKLEVAGNAKLTGTNLSIVPSTATSAAYTLNTNTGGNFFLGIDSSTGASFTGTAYGRFLYSGGAYPLVILTNDTERVRITSAGLVGIGTSSPASKLHLSSSASTAQTITSVGTNVYSSISFNNTTTGYGYDIGFGGSASIAPNSFYVYGGSSASVKMQIDAAGNMGLGVTPSAWYTADGVTRALQISGTGALTANNDAMRVMQNAFFNTSGAATYISNGYAEQYLQNGGQHAWYTAPSGTAGNAISFTQAMTLTAAGNLGIGTTLPVTALTLGTGTTGVCFRSNLDTLNSGKIAVIKPSEAGTGNGHLIFETYEGGSGGGERVRITNAGNVGIGTSSPSAKLNVVGGNSIFSNTTSEAGFNSTGSNRYSLISAASTSGTMYLGVNGTSAGAEIDVGGILENASFFGARTNNATQFLTNNSVRATIDSSGNLLVGGTTALAKNYTTQTANAVALGAENQIGSFTSTVFQTGAYGTVAGTGFRHIECLGSAAQTVFQVLGNGNAQNTNNSYGAVSDVKLKENIVDATPKLDKLNQVRIVNYNLIGEEQKQLGVIAQELEQIFPSMIDETPDKSNKQLLNH
jgi:hypothetical protein